MSPHEDGHRPSRASKAPATPEPNPYASPTAAAAPETGPTLPAGGPAAPLPPAYRPGGAVATIAQSLLWANAVLHGLTVVFWLVFAHRLRHQQAAWADTLVFQASLLATATAVLYLLTAVFFTLWFHRAYRNLLALGRPATNFATWWAAAGFYIPLANLVVPYLLARELWVHSDPTEVRAERGGLMPPDRSAPLVGLWWPTFLGGQFLSRAATRATEDLGENLRAALWLHVATGALYVVAAACGALIVRGAERRQRAREALIRTPPASGDGGPSGAPPAF